MFLVNKSWLPLNDLPLIPHSDRGSPGSALQSPNEENGNKVLTQGDKLNLIKARKHTQSLRPMVVENLKSSSHSRVKSVPAAIKVSWSITW